jgi:hypothetical protein
MSDDTGQVAVVTEQDVDRIRAQFKPGSVHPAKLFFTMYVGLMEADGRPVAHQTALGHALRRAGFVRHRARRRVNGRQEETCSWIVPGGPPANQEDERMGHVLRSLGPGVHANRLIWDRYSDLAREHGWTWAMGEIDLARWLTKHNFVRLRDNGGSRFVPPEKIPSA